MLVIDLLTCLECGGCVPLCPVEALSLSFDKLTCDQNLCTLCGACIDFCPVGALAEVKRLAV